jgi:hypothetical protein
MWGPVPLALYALSKCCNMGLLTKTYCSIRLIQIEAGVYRIGRSAVTILEFWRNLYMISYQHIDLIMAEAPCLPESIEWPAESSLGKVLARL